MKRYVLAVCAMLVLAGGAAHAIPFDRIPLISNTLGDIPNRLCAGAATPQGQADIACPSYSPYVTSGGLLGVGTSSPTATLQVSGKPAVPACMWGRVGMWGLVRRTHTKSYKLRTVIYV